MYSTSDKTLQEIVDFNKFSDDCGNKFLALSYLCKESRETLTNVNNSISINDTFNWIISNKHPKNLHFRMIQQSEKSDVESLSRRLCDICQDAAIKEAVIQSLCLSRSQGHLIYQYTNITSSSKQARVRVLCNIIWEEILSE